MEANPAPSQQEPKPAEQAAAKTEANKASASQPLKLSGWANVVKRAGPAASTQADPAAAPSSATGQSESAGKKEEALSTNARPTEQTGAGQVAEAKEKPSSKSGGGGERGNRGGGKHQDSAKGGAQAVAAAPGDGSGSGAADKAAVAATAAANLGGGAAPAAPAPAGQDDGAATEGAKEGAKEAPKPLKPAWKKVRLCGRLCVSVLLFAHACTHCVPILPSPFDRRVNPLHTPLHPQHTNTSPPPPRPQPPPPPSP